MVKSGMTAALVGMVYGGIPAARHARERFIQLNQAEMFSSRVEAVVRGTHSVLLIGITVLHKNDWAAMKTELFYQFLHGQTH